MIINFTPKHCDLGIAIHAVIGSAENQNNFDHFCSQSFYDQLSTAFGGVCIPKLVYVADRVINKKGYKSFDEIESKGVDLEFDINAQGYTDLNNFFNFAELLYLVNLMYYMVNNFHHSDIVLTGENANINEFVNQCAEKAADNLIQASRVLYVDGSDYMQMFYIESDASPLPFLRPIFGMIHNSLDPSVLAAIAKDFGVNASHSLASVSGDLNMQVLKSCSLYSQASANYFY